MPGDGIATTANSHNKITFSLSTGGFRVDCCLALPLWC